MKKVLVFGLGSIGIKHLEVLRRIGEYEIAAFRTRKGAKIIPRNLEKRIKYFDNEDEAFAWKPDLMIVSNPSSLHLEYLLKSINHNIDTLIEKPLADGYNRLKRWEGKIKKRKNKVYVGFNLRFHPIVKKIKEIIDSHKYGKVLKANLYVGEYLPFWHPYEDYSYSYAARKKLGGGCLKTMSHEIDLGQYWFGSYSKIFSQVSKISDLDIDVDDNANIFAIMKKGAILTIAMDYLNPLSERRGELFFQTGLLKYDFSENKIKFIDYLNKKSKTLLKLDDYDINDSYRCQIEKLINRSDEEICSLEEGKNVVKIIKRCEESSQTGRVIDV